ncbi:MAG TPA: hypothetical protein VGM33_24205 [Baekduia sp.]|jgi:hypothetical protein
MGTDGGGASALVERGDELRTLGRLVDGATDGEGGLVVVEGPPGIGATRNGARGLTGAPASLTAGSSSKSLPRSASCR